MMRTRSTSNTSGRTIAANRSIAKPIARRSTGVREEQPALLVLFSPDRRPGTCIEQLQARHLEDGVANDPNGRTHALYRAWRGDSAVDAPRSAGRAPSGC